jgi:hypothetical protein
MRGREAPASRRLSLPEPKLRTRPVIVYWQEQVPAQGLLFWQEKLI